MGLRERWREGSGEWWGVGEYGGREPGREEENVTCVGGRGWGEKEWRR